MASVERLPLEDSFRLREYLGVLWVRKWTVLALALVGFIAAYYFTQKETKLYASTVSVIATDPLALIDQQRGPDMSVERSVVISEPVKSCAALLSQPLEENWDANQDINVSKTCTRQALQQAEQQPDFQRLEAGLTKNLLVTVQPDSTVLVIKKSAPKPARARAVTQAFALSYLNYRTQTATAELDRRRAPFQARLKTLDAQMASVQKQISEQLAAVVVNVPAMNSLLQQRSAIEQERTSIFQQLLDLSPAKINPPQVVAPATLPNKASSPNQPINVLLGLFVGLALGIGVAFLMAHLDDKVRSPADVETSVGLPALAVIPKERKWSLGLGGPYLVTRAGSRSPAAEAYRRLRTSLLLASARRGVRSLLLCGPNASAAKTAANVALSLADINKRVILVCADLRRPRLHQIFGLQNRVGLSTLLAEDVPLVEVLQNPDEESLRVLTSGPPPSRPGEALQAERMRPILAQLREIADFTIVETAPLLVAADAATLSAAVDGLILIAECGVTRRTALAQAVGQLHQLGATILGVVLTEFDPAKVMAHLPSAGSYRYGYPFGSTAGLGISGDGEVPLGGRVALPAPLEERDSPIARP
ncbi:MAG: polysaccharide biosynthesis tyrosine autokinase [Actinobacteria bacterium]|nr:MAG: polysaccharide biosynthesis tyrosine autokinase [Actinomycetota bacterium]